MPRKTDSIAIKDPFLERRIKLLPCQKEMVIWWRENKGLSQRELARLFKVSRRTIIFVLDPQKLIENKKRREERGGSKQYYDKVKNKEAIKEHRDYKKQILNETIKRK